MADEQKPLRGARKRSVADGKVAARVAAADIAAPRVTGVTLLNPGFFALERMREAGSRASRKAGEKPKRVRGK